MDRFQQQSLRVIHWLPLSISGEIGSYLYLEWAKWAVRANKQMDEQVARYFSLYFWLFWPMNVHTWIEKCRCRDRHAMVQNNQKSRLKYSATRSSIRLFACTIHSFTCSTLLASLMRSAVLTYWLTCSPAHSHTRGIVNDMMATLSVSFSVLDHSGTGMNG